MPGSNSVIRRYTPPTCTLEISAQSSPLSRWMGQTVINQLRFELHFDDPTLPEELRVPIQGDRDQLEALCNAVTNYVQQLLQKSADSFCFTFLESPPSSTTSDQPELKDVTPTSPTPKIPHPSSMGILEATIYLESSDNLTHKLYLGSLANPTSGPIIQLTLLQLFDLATALDEYSTDVITLPNLKSDKRTENRIPSLPTWTPIAAMFALAVGLTPLTWQYANSIKQSQQQTADQNSATDKIALEPSPDPNLNASQPGLTPPSNLPSPPSISDTLELPNLDPPPPPADSTLDPKPLTFPNATVPDTFASSQKNALTIPQTSKPVLPSNLQIPSSSTPSFQQGSTGVISQSGLPSENTSSIPPIPSSITTLPNDLQSQIPPQISSPLESQQLNRGANSATQAPAVASNDDLVAKLRAARTAPSPTQVAADENKLFDIPQAAEARAYLQKNWRPPAGFSQTLEYSLMLGVDGSIERILPLNRAAREYIDNTGMPQIGNPFVSTNKAGQSLKLRVVFTPDGKVQTFPETP
jgi:type II secretory pathway pseudopilin PulG